MKPALVVKWISRRSSEPSLGVRIPPSAHNRTDPSVQCNIAFLFKIKLEAPWCLFDLPLINRVFLKTVDNYVCIVHKGQFVHCL